MYCTHTQISPGVGSDLKKNETTKIVMTGRPIITWLDAKKLVNWFAFTYTPVNKIKQNKNKSNNKIKQTGKTHHESFYIYM